MNNLLLIFLSLFFSFNAYAYKEETHQDLSESAVNISNLVTVNGLLSDLGLSSVSTLKLPSPINSTEHKTITNLIRDGAFFEDNFPRSLSHFYNPLNNEPGAGGDTSPDWALEDNGDVDPNKNGEQLYSYKDAMNYFFLALTSQTEEMRNENWGKVFQTLGQVIHHVQDMAQPDHVRNDKHCDHYLCAALLSHDKSWYEQYTNDHKGDSYFTNLMSSNAYPIPEFSSARDFWTTQAADPAVTNRRGIADFTNRNFVSKDTIFKINNGSFVPGNDFDLPAPDPVPNIVDIATIMGSAGQDLCDSIKARSMIAFPASNCFLHFISTPVTGTVAGEPTTNTRAASYSIFDKKLQDHNVDPIFTREDGSIDTIDRSFTLNEFNFKAAHDYLIPRAVAYSAGLINHFFRGKIDMIPNPNSAGWVIQNQSNEEMQGTFTLYYDYVDPADGLEKRAAIPGAVWNEIIAANSEVVVGDYTVPAGLIRKILLFDGDVVGVSERLIAARVLDEINSFYVAKYEGDITSNIQTYASEFSLKTYMPNRDYILNNTINFSAPLVYIDTNTNVFTYTDFPVFQAINNTLKIHTVSGSASQTNEPLFSFTWLPTQMYDAGLGAINSNVIEHNYRPLAAMSGKATSSSTTGNRYYYVGYAGTNAVYMHSVTYPGGRENNVYLSRALRGLSVYQLFKDYLYSNAWVCFSADTPTTPCLSFWHADSGPTAVRGAFNFISNYTTE